MRFDERVYSAVKKIPKGKVATYKGIGKALHTKAYRLIGQVLRRNKNAPAVPCHRVVCYDGGLGGYCGKMNSRKKVMLLRKEGIIVKDGKIIDFEKNNFIF
jgi:methylated-DNA-[protein]-cysteine S-methyltransferase